ncbi:regulatory protein ToxS [Vibrio sp. S4M6]|uniref:regulatory protein ToxS n=1 Tax=Vibrio sinus TaxID=2946865 RepID=UPI002029FA60|nr:regulatory protein ToxS [Vibrio sinus]MCL9782846.1 regulatory protein ToxS [Vibrio sinus]
MNKKIAAGLLGLSILFSGWLYWGSDLKVEQILTSQEWQSNMVTVIDTKLPEEAIGPIKKGTLISNVKYLPNGTYIRSSVARLYAEENGKVVLANVINISEAGKWSISDDYLIVSPTEFKDVTSAETKEFTQKQLHLITQLIRMDAQQSRRIDVVNDKTLLLTSLGHGSTLLSTD